MAKFWRRLVDKLKKLFGIRVEPPKNKDVKPDTKSRRLPGRGG